MKKADWQFLVDALMFICMVGIAIIGILLAFIIPEGPSSPESSKYFLYLHRHQWANIHLYLSLSFVALLIVHLTFDWKWIKGRANRIFKQRWKTALSSTFLVSLVVLFIIWLFYPKEPGAYEDYGLGRGKREAASILPESRLGGGELYQETQDQDILTVTGQMTLLDLEKLSGVPAARIIEALGLPSKASREETLGRLRKKYGFSLLEMRDVLTQLMNEAQEKQEQETLPIDIPEQSQSEEVEIPVHGRLEEEEAGILITGQMSLFDIQAMTGLPARQIADKLGLPQEAPLGESLGKLRKAYLFSVEDVRTAISDLFQKEDHTAQEIPEIQVRQETEEEHAEEQKMARGRMAEDQSALLITGQMSLYQIQRQTGVSARLIIEKLGLPSNVSHHENIGRLRRRYGFTITELRDIVVSLMKKR